MTSPAREVEIRCPKCSHVFQDWYRASINSDLDPWADEDYIEAATTATCPKCGRKFFSPPALVVEEKDEVEEWLFS